MYNDVCSGNNPIIMTNYYCCCIISIHLHNIKFLFISEMQLNRRDFFCFLPTGNQCGKQEAQSLCTNRLIYVISPVECIVILLDSSSPNLPNKLELIKRHIMRNYKSQSSRVFIFFNSYVQYVYDNQSCNWAEFQIWVVTDYLGFFPRCYLLYTLSLNFLCHLLSNFFQLHVKHVISFQCDVTMALLMQKNLYSL